MMFLILSVHFWLVFFFFQHINNFSLTVPQTADYTFTEVRQKKKAGKKIWAGSREWNDTYEIVTPLRAHAQKRRLHFPLIKKAMIVGTKRSESKKSLRRRDVSPVEFSFFFRACHSVFDFYLFIFISRHSSVRSARRRKKKSFVVSFEK